MNILYFFIYLLLVSSVISQPQEEIDSFNWIILNYQLNFPIAQFKCGNVFAGSRFVCDSNNFTTEIIANNQGPPPQRTELTFSKLQTFQFQLVDPLYVPPQSLLDLLLPNSVPKLFSLLVSDDAMKSIPSTIVTLPSLTYLQLKSDFITSVPTYVLYPVSPLSSLILGWCAITTVGWDFSKQTTITYLQLGLAVNNNDFEIDSSKFVKDIYLKVDLNLFRSSNSTIHIEMTNVDHLTLLSNNDPFRPSINLTGSFYKMRNFDIKGSFSSFSPQNISLMPNLNIYSQKVSPGTFSVFPYPVIGQSISYIYYQENQLLEFPTFTFDNFIPDKIFLYMGSNLLSGAIPDRFYGKFYFMELSLNIGLNGSLSNDSCLANHLDISNTAIENAPDCFKCHYQALTSLPPQSNFINTPFYSTFNYTTNFSCPIEYTPHVITNNLNYITITGNNLGWCRTGDCDKNVVMLVRNRQFQYKFDRNQRSAHIVLSNLSKIAIDVTYEIQGFNIINVTLEQSVHGVEVTVYLEMFLGYSFMLFDLDGVGCISLMRLLQGTGGTVSKYTTTCNSAPAGLKNFTVSMDYSSATAFADLTTSFPVVTGATQLNISGGIITIYGEFGGDPNTLVLVDNRTCEVISNTKDTIICDVSGQFELGYRNLFIDDYSYKFESDSMVFVRNMTIDDSDFCKSKFNNCSGNGYCDINGQCICNHGFYGIKCNQEIATGPIIIDTTTPSASIVYKDFAFNYSMVAIQELDAMGSIVKELNVEDGWFITSYKKEDGLSSINYQFRENDIKLEINSLLQITNASKELDIFFGGEMIKVGPNSVKISLNITGWTYLTALTHLRVLYRSPITLDRCTNEPISIINDKSNMTIQFLRVLKDDVEFFGKFPSISITDGKPSISSVVIVNQTLIPGSEASTVIIGSNLPQCGECILDPDFSSLVSVDRNSYSKCEPTKSNKWKIIVGVVVGGIAFLAVAFGSVFFFKKKIIYRKEQRKMQKKLQNIN